MKIRILTAGESHGKALCSILEGIPAGLEISKTYIDNQLQRRKKGYGRGGRMQIEADQVEIIAGIRHGVTIGSPVALNIENKDWQNWKTVMEPAQVDMNDHENLQKMQEKKIEYVRPGHADLSGMLKYNHLDVRNVLERSSARETASRVAAASLCRKLLEEFNIHIFSHIIRIGNAGFENFLYPENLESARKIAEESEVRCIDTDIEALIKKEIDNAKETGDTLGGTIQIIATGLPVGLGSYVNWDKRLDGLIAQAIMSVPAIKSVEIGLGARVSGIPGSKVHDEIFPKNTDGEYTRYTNNAGGIEGGMTNGMPLIVTAAMKPIPTLKKPLRSVNVFSGIEHVAHYERSDVCAVPSAGIVCESMLAYILANVFLDKFGGDSLEEIKSNFNTYKTSYQKR